MRRRIYANILASTYLRRQLVQRVQKLVLIV